MDDDSGVLDSQRVQWILYAVVAADAALYLFLFDTVRNAFDGNVTPLTAAILAFYVLINVGATYLVVHYN